MHDDDPKDVPDLRWRPSLRRHVLVPLFWIGCAVLVMALLVGWQVLQEESRVVLVLCLVGVVASVIWDVWRVAKGKTD